MITFSKGGQLFSPHVFEALPWIPIQLDPRDFPSLEENFPYLMENGTRHPRRQTYHLNYSTQLGTWFIA